MLFHGRRHGHAAAVESVQQRPGVPGRFVIQRGTGSQAGLQAFCLSLLGFGLFRSGQRDLKRLLPCVVPDVGGLGLGCGNDLAALRLWLRRQPRRPRRVRRTFADESVTGTGRSP